MLSREKCFSLVLSFLVFGVSIEANADSNRFDKECFDRKISDENLMEIYDIDCAAMSFDLSEISYSKDFGNVQDVRLHAEWESKNAVMIHSPQVTVTSAQTAQLIETKIVHTYTDHLIEALQEHSPGTFVRVVPCKVVEPWGFGQSRVDMYLRDHSPLQVEVTMDGGETREVLVVPSTVQSGDLGDFCRSGDCPQSVVYTNIRLIGGYTITDGNRACATTKSAFREINDEMQKVGAWKKIVNFVRRKKEDIDFHPNLVASLFKSYLGCEKLFLLEPGPDYSGHVDVIAKFLPPSSPEEKPRILLADWQTEGDRFSKDDNLTKERLEGLRSNITFFEELGEYEIKLIKMAGRAVRRPEYGNLSAYIITAYPNSLIVGETVYVPVFGYDSFAYVSPESSGGFELERLNEAALNTYSEVFPNVVPVRVPPVWIRNGGGPRCMTSVVYE